MSEYAIEVRKNLGNNVCQFIKQINICYTLEEARKYLNSSLHELQDNEFLSIVEIIYDDEGNEIGVEYIEDTLLN